MRSGNFTNGDKRSRTILSNEQKAYLKDFYSRKTYPSAEEIELISQKLSLKTKRVLNWFTNQRQLSKNLI